MPKSVDPHRQQANQLLLPAVTIWTLCAVDALCPRGLRSARRASWESVRQPVTVSPHNKISLVPHVVYPDVGRLSEQMTWKFSRPVHCIRPSSQTLLRHVVQTQLGLIRLENGEGSDRFSGVVPHLTCSMV